MRELVGTFVIDWNFIANTLRSRHWSQAHFARKLGITRSRISKLKSGEFPLVYGPVFARLLTTMPEYVSGCDAPFRAEVTRFREIHPLCEHAEPRLTESICAKLREDVQRLWLTLPSENPKSRAAAIRWCVQHFNTAQTSLLQQLIEGGLWGRIGSNEFLDPREVLQKILTWGTMRPDRKMGQSLQRLGTIRVSLPAGQVGAMAALKRLNARVREYGAEIKWVSSYFTSIDQVLALGQDEPHFSISGIAPFFLNSGPRRDLGNYRLVCPLTYSKQHCYAPRSAGEVPLQTVHVCTGASGELDYRIHRSERYGRCDRRELQPSAVREVIRGWSKREGIILWEPMGSVLKAEGVVSSLYRKAFPVWLGLFSHRDLVGQSACVDFAALFLEAYAESRQDLVGTERMLLADEQFCGDYAKSAGLQLSHVPIA